MQEESTTRTGRASSLSVFSWSLYDFANTVFSISILSYFFPLWLGDELGGGPELFNYVTAAAMFLVVLTAPVFGAIGDLRQSRKPFLVVLTLIAVVCVFGMNFFGTVTMAVALFVAGNFTYQSALIFYNSLLPSVAGQRGTGRVSGYGAAAGYVGALSALVLLTFFVTDPEGVRSLLGPLGFWLDDEEQNANAFLPTAVLYLLFSLPLFLFVPDRRIREPRPVTVLGAYRGVFRTLREIRSYPGMGAFILATILFTDTANTVVSNMSLYGRVVFDMEQAEIRNLLLFSTVFAALGATGAGFLSDRQGPRRTMMGVVVLWLVAVFLATAATEAWMLLMVGPLAGIALGSTWVVSRALLVALAPPEKLGEFFGFYGLAGRFSAVTGPATAGVILTVFDGLGTGAYRLAVLSLAVTLIISFLLLRRVPDARPEPTVREFSG